MKKKSLFLLLLSLYFSLNSFSQNSAGDCTDVASAFGKVIFKPGSCRLNDEAKTMLDAIAEKMRKNPSCKVVVTGFCSASDEAKQLSWDQVNTVVNRYMIMIAGIAEKQFIFLYAKEGGECNTVTFRIAEEGEDGPGWVAPPFPDYRKSK